MFVSSFANSIDEIVKPPGACKNNSSNATSSSGSSGSNHHQIDGAHQESESSRREVTEEEEHSTVNPDLETTTVASTNAAPLENRDDHAARSSPSEEQTQYEAETSQHHSSHHSQHQTTGVQLSQEEEEKIMELQQSQILWQKQQQQLLYAKEQRQRQLLRQAQQQQFYRQEHERMLASFYKKLEGNQFSQDFETKKGTIKLRMRPYRGQMLLTWPENLETGASLSNLGNTCFLNSVLQCLTHTSPFARSCLEKVHSRFCESENKWCVFCEVERHVCVALTGTRSQISPTRIANNLSGIAAHFNLGQQEDTHELLRCLADSLRANPTRNEKYPGIIFDIFGGILESRIRCSVCREISRRREPFFDLSLEIDNVISLQEVLESFAKVEDLSGNNMYKCEKCAKLSPAKKQLTIQTAPPILTLHLKRFCNDQQKISSRIQYEEYLDLTPYMSPPDKGENAKEGQKSSANGSNNTAGENERERYIYQIYALIFHWGHSISTGHYTAAVCNSQEEWIHYDDHIVEKLASVNFVLSQPSAYMLFYKRINPIVNLPHLPSGFELPKPTVLQPKSGFSWSSLTSSSKSNESSNNGNNAESEKRGFQQSISNGVIALFIGYFLVFLLRMVVDGPNHKEESQFLITAASYILPLIFLGVVVAYALIEDSFSDVGDENGASKYAQSVFAGAMLAFCHILFVPFLLDKGGL